jgi:sarcosine oxidase subunit alpha
LHVGAESGVTPCGTEAMHVLRAEKAFIVVGQDTDGSVTPLDLSKAAMVSRTKVCLGMRSLSRSDALRSDRKQLVGLMTDDPRFVLLVRTSSMNRSSTSDTPDISVHLFGRGHVDTL